MEAPRASHNLFEVYLRLRPPPPGVQSSERILSVEIDEDEYGNGTGSKDDCRHSHIVLNPPTDRRRAIEKFAFTQVLEESATQLDVFHSVEVLPLVEGVLAPDGGDGTDAVVATLGVTGSGKTHTILGSKSQRGLTQMALEVLFNSIDSNTPDASALYTLQDSLQACDSSESTLTAAPVFLDAVFGDGFGVSRACSRAATPMVVGTPTFPSVKSPSTPRAPHGPIPCTFPDSPMSSPRSVIEMNNIDEVARYDSYIQPCRTTQIRSSKALAKSPKRASQKPFMSLTTSTRCKTSAKQHVKGDHHLNGSFFSPAPRKHLTRPSALPPSPDVSGIEVSCDSSAEYVVVVSMYEVHNDRIYDLLVPAAKSGTTKEVRRRPLLFKSTELSPDRKVVAGLRKVVCTNVRDALLVLDAGLQERRVAGTGSNSVSSRSHGFFCFEVKKRIPNSRRPGTWGGSKLTIVDLAGSERARDAKTQGATLVEAGKINESLMYLGQCLQTQSEAAGSSRPNIVPYRQCKLTELLFSNSFPTTSTSSHPHHPRRNPQKGVMIVTADPLGDFNATSQILRYSALAREVTVPRIPSISTTILANAPMASAARPASPPQQHHPRPFMPPGSGSYRNHTPLAADERATMEIAALEIARLSDEIDQLRVECDRQTELRFQAEAHLMSMEDRFEDLESTIRQDCAIEYEQRFDLDFARFKAEKAMEQELQEEFIDRKVDLVGTAMDVDCDKENVLTEDIQEEMERLRHENSILKRELAGRSPTKRRPLEERDDFSPSPGPGSPALRGSEGLGNLGTRLEEMRMSSDGSGVRGQPPTSPKKMRKLPARKWQGLEELS